MLRNLEWRCWFVGRKSRSVDDNALVGKVLGSTARSNVARSNDCGSIDMRSRGGVWYSNMRLVSFSVEPVRVWLIGSLGSLAVVWT